MLSSSIHLQQPLWMNFIQGPSTSDDPEQLIGSYIDGIRWSSGISNDPVAKAIHQFALEQLKNKILALYDQNKLGRYYVFALGCEIPDIFQDRRVNVIEELKAFGGELANNPYDLQMRLQSKKISDLIHRDPALEQQFPYHLLYLALTTSDKKPFIFDRFLWSAWIPVFVPFLLGVWQQREPLTISEKTLRIIDDCLHNKPLSFNLTLQEFFQLYQDTEYLQFPIFQEKIVLMINYKINNQIDQITIENFFQILKISLKQQNKELINHCICFICSQANGGLNLTNCYTHLFGRLLGKKCDMLSIEINEINDFVEYFLLLFGDDIFKVKINIELIEELKGKKIGFPRVEVIDLQNGFDQQSIKNLSYLQELFPNAKKCHMSMTLFKKLRQEHIANWKKVEFLTVRDNATRRFFDEKALDYSNLALVKNPPAHLKLVTVSPRSIGPPVVLKPRGETLFCIGNTGELKYNFSPLKEAISDEVLFEILFESVPLSISIPYLDLSGFNLKDEQIIDVVRIYRSLRHFNLSDCNLNEKTILFIAEELPLLTYLNVQSSKALSNEALQQLSKHFPHCTFVFPKQNLEEKAPKRLKLDP